MRITSRRRLARYTLGVAAAALAAVLLAPAGARAECGHYVTVGGKPAAMEASTTHATHSPASPTEPVTPRREHRPCSGPLCPKAPLQVPPATPQTSSDRDDRTVFLSTFQAPDLEAGAYLTDEIGGQPVRFASSIFHPPRPSHASA